MYLTALLDKYPPKKILLFVLCLFLIKEIVVATYIGNKPSPITDGYSERNTINGVAHWQKIGITTNAGLPDHCAYKIIPRETAESSCVYTHYPPGPDYLIWIYQFFTGGSLDIRLLRVFPILINFLCAWFFIISIIQSFESRRAFCLGLMLSLVPMFSNFWHGLHYQGYALSLFLVQISLYLRNKNNLLSFHFLLMSFLLSFLQGWLSFDFAFIASFILTPFLILNKHTFKEWFLITLCNGLGFSVAFFLHFYQVVLYFGNAQEAIADFTNSAVYRAKNSGTDPLTRPGLEKLHLFTNLKDFLWRIAGRGKYLSINLINFIWIILGLMFIRKIEFKKSRFVFLFNIDKFDIFALASAIFISGLWGMVMKQHSFIHGFIARHYYLTYFTCCVILINKTSTETKSDAI